MGRVEQQVVVYRVEAVPSGLRAKYRNNVEEINRMLAVGLMRDGLLPIAGGKACATMDANA